MVYSPVGTAAKAKTPSELLTVRRVSPESWFFNVMLAPGTTAPDWSATVPVSCPVRFCPYPAANAEQTRLNANSAPYILLNDFILRVSFAENQSNQSMVLTGTATTDHTTCNRPSP